MIRSNRDKEVGLSEEEKKIAAKLKELAAAADKEAMEETDYEQMSPIEQLSADIAAHLANNAACRIAGIIEEANQGSAKQLVIRFENSDSRTLVRMIQAIFLSHGMKHAAEELDVLEDCEPFDCEVFDAFADEFLGAEEIDRYTVEAWFIVPASDSEGEVVGWLKS